MIVVKIGGALGSEVDPILDNLAELLKERQGPAILVHGGSKSIDELGEQLGVPQKSIKSPQGIESRHTTKETLSVLTLALTGRLNPAIVTGLNLRGVNALGLSGVDGRLVEAKRKSAIRALVNDHTVLVKDSYTGKIVRVNGDLLLKLSATGIVPVVSPPAIDLADGPVNVDADRMAAAIAAAVQADCLVMLTNMQGLLVDPRDPASLIHKVHPEAFDDAASRAKGRMKLKLIATKEALEGGVPVVVISDGRETSPITRALNGAGTHFHASPAPAESTQRKSA